MAKFSIVNIEHTSTGVIYKVYWNQSKHNHGASVATGTWAMTALAAHLGGLVTDLNYRSSSFQSNQSREPTGANVFEID
jgi:hypothetical protein